MQTPPATFNKGFSLAQSQAFTKACCHQDPFDPLLRGGLLTKVAYQTRGRFQGSNTRRSQTVPKALPSPTAKPPIRRPESTPSTPLPYTQVSNPAKCTPQLYLSRDMLPIRVYLRNCSILCHTLEDSYQKAGLKAALQDGFGREDSVVGEWQPITTVKAETTISCD